MVLCIRVRIHVYIHVQACIFHPCMRAYTHVHTWVYTCTHLGMHMYTLGYTHVHTWVCTCTHLGSIVRQTTYAPLIEIIKMKNMSKQLWSLTELHVADPMHACMYTSVHHKG